jgi:hypothetical protein
MQSRLKNNLLGQRHGLWYVLSYAYRRSGRQFWRCRCTGCGTIRDVESYNLTSGRSRACRLCSAAVVGLKLTTHGQSRSTLYARWQGMWTRCTNPRSKSWKYHGAMGVRVCPEWASFEQFHRDMGDPPSSHHTLDRWPDPFGHYEPGNVRWATQSEQMENTRRAWLLRQG